MIFSYTLNRYDEDGYIYIVKHNSMRFEFIIDFNKFKKYTVVNNWFDMENYYINENHDLKKLPYTYNTILYDKKEYHKLTQYEYDKYFYILNIVNDNHYLYKELYDKLVDYYKKEYYQTKNKNKKIKITEI